MDALQWPIREKRSKQSPPSQPDADEISAAESLLLLSISAGDFCSASIMFPPKAKKHSAALEIGAARAGSPDTPLLNNHYCCWLCGEVFQSSQALGGHMTSHRAKIAVSHRNSAAESGRFHACNFCHERFATGQALGGHKRKHYEGPALVRKAAKYCHSTFSNPGDSGEESYGGGARPLLDLNLPLPPEFY